MGLIFFAFFEKFFVPILTSGGLAAVSSSFFAALSSAFGKYDVVHIHAEGPAFFTWLPKMFGKRVVVTVHGIDWQREKWQSGLALIMCPEEDSASVEWARQKGENWVNKDITSLEFVENIFKIMNWNRECRYKVLGRVANSDQGLCMLFDLEEAIMFTPKPQEYTDPITGEMKKKQMKFFPDAYKNRIGKSYNDYVADHQLNMFEDFIGYQGSAVLDESVREEDTVPKLPMTQKNELPENTALPHLPEQPVNMQQSSYELDERGMPT